MEDNFKNLKLSDINEELNKFKRQHQLKSIDENDEDESDHSDSRMPSKASAAANAKSRKVNFEDKQDEDSESHHFSSDGPGSDDLSPINNNMPNIMVNNLDTL